MTVLVDAPDVVEDSSPGRRQAKRTDQSSSSSVRRFSTPRPIRRSAPRRKESVRRAGSAVPKRGTSVTSSRSSARRLGHARIGAIIRFSRHAKDGRNTSRPSGRGLGERRICRLRCLDSDAENISMEPLLRRESGNGLQHVVGRRHLPPATLRFFYARDLDADDPDRHDRP